MADILLIIDSAHSVFRPVSEKAKAAMTNGDFRTNTHPFTLPAQMAHYQVKHGLEIEIQDERGGEDAPPDGGSYGTENPGLVEDQP